MDTQIPESDRRRFDRFPVDYPISYISEDNSDMSGGMAVNLSEGGLLAHLFDRISVGTELDLEMFYTSELQFTSLSAQAKIVWKDIKETREAIEYQYGIEFIRINRQDKTKLLRLLASIKPAYYSPSKENTIPFKKPV
ncbi:MAG: hypothetical protein GTO13_03175 [Proteobacteria bacterium]|nr:hypothetical protein [Pseudomonadota bacterium]